MSGVSLPVTRPTGRALVIGLPPCRLAPMGTLGRMGFTCAEVDEPYAAMVELCRRPLVYRAMILSLASLYREEMLLIQAVKRRWPHVDIWLTHTDGRHAALADAMRFGADGLLSEDGLHRTAVSGYSPENFYPSDDSVPAKPRAGQQSKDNEPPEMDDDPTGSEPILTAEELRALLADQPVMPPADME